MFVISWCSLERVIREVRGSNVWLSLSIQQLRQVSLMHSEPSLGCVPSLYFLCMQFNTESYCRSVMSTFQYHTLSPLESNLWVWVICLVLQSRWDGFLNNNLINGH